MRHTRSLGIPPLGGIASYEEAARPGLGVEENVRLLRRYAYVERRLMEMAVSHLCAVPEWEVKCALSLHCWLDAEHATTLRHRVAEMREPPLHLDEVPDTQLAVWLDEALHARGTVELLVSLYRVIKPVLLAAYQRHVATTNPLADYPTHRHLRAMITEEEEMVAWGEAALAACLVDAREIERATTWAAHLQAYLQAAGGIWGTEKAEDVALPAARASEPFVVDVRPRRDGRIGELLDPCRYVDGVAVTPSRSPRERMLALLWKRLREMDVPELMAPIIARTPGKPWDYYRDMTRQLWDEARHAQMGEAAFVSMGIDWTTLPIPMDFSYLLNRYLTPLESHVLLYDIEQGLMNRKTGKRSEWEVALKAENPLAITFQDYDWADEVLHAQIGRRWLIPELGDRDHVARVAEQAWAKIRHAADSEPGLLDSATQEKQLALEIESTWWTEFYATFLDHEASGAAPIATSKKAGQVSAIGGG